MTTVKKMETKSQAMHQGRKETPMKKNETVASVKVRKN